MTFAAKGSLPSRRRTGDRGASGCGRGRSSPTPSAPRRRRSGFCRRPRARPPSAGRSRAGITEGTALPWKLPSSGARSRSPDNIPAEAVRLSRAVPETPQLLGRLAPPDTRSRVRAGGIPCSRTSLRARRAPRCLSASASRRSFRLLCPSARGGRRLSSRVSCRP